MRYFTRTYWRVFDGLNENIRRPCGTYLWHLLYAHEIMNCQKKYSVVLRCGAWLNEKARVWILRMFVNLHSREYVFAIPHRCWLYNGRKGKRNSLGKGLFRKPGRFYLNGLFSFSGFWGFCIDLLIVSLCPLWRRLNRWQVSFSVLKNQITN